MTVKELEAFEPLLDGYIFHDHVFLRNPGYHEHLAKLRKAGRSITHYTCSTRMTEDLDREFRQNAWMAERWNLTGNWIYQGIDAKGGTGAPNFKLCQHGGLLYRSGEAFMPSLRGLALRQGVMDVKYLAALRKIGKDDPSAQKFLATAAQRVTDNPAGGDRRVADNVRDEAAELILKLWGK